MAAGTAIAVPSNAARSGTAEPSLGATRSATSVPTPASRMSPRSSSDSSTSDSDQRSEKAGSRVVRLMKTKPWVRNAPATASRVRRRDTGRIVADRLYGDPVNTWDRRMEWPLTIAAVVFLGAYAWPILDPDLSSGLQTTCSVIGWAVWVLFAVDYVARVAGADDRVSWIVRHPLEIVVLVLPMLRPLRVLRLVMLLRVLNRTAAGNLRGRVAIYVSVGACLIAFVAALAVLDAERDAAGASITTFGDAMWWACTTMSTVGYGDLYPVTTSGRFIAVGLMFGGIALLGTVTATFASWLVEAVREEADETEDQLDVVLGELAAVRQRLDRVLEEK